MIECRSRQTTIAFFPLGRRHWMKRYINYTGGVCVHACLVCFCTRYVRQSCCCVCVYLDTPVGGAAVCRRLLLSNYERRASSSTWR